MCKSQAEGGQRCATHTGVVYATKRAEYLLRHGIYNVVEGEDLSALIVAATLYATTRRGILDLAEEIRSISDAPSETSEAYATILQGALQEGQRQRAITKEVERQIALARTDEEARTKEVAKAVRTKERDNLGKTFATEYALRPEMAGKSKWEIYKATRDAINRVYEETVAEQISLIENQGRVNFDNEGNRMTAEELLRAIFEIPIEVENAATLALDTPEVKKAGLLRLASRKAARALLLAPDQRLTFNLSEGGILENQEDDNARVKETNIALSTRDREEDAKHFVETYSNRPEMAGKSKWEIYKIISSRAEQIFEDRINEEVNSGIDLSSDFTDNDDETIRDEVIASPEGREAEKVFRATRRIARELLLASEETSPEDIVSLQNSGDSSENGTEGGHDADGHALNDFRYYQPGASENDAESGHDADGHALNDFRYYQP